VAAVGQMQQHGGGAVPSVRANHFARHACKAARVERGHRLVLGKSKGGDIGG